MRVDDKFMWYGEGGRKGGENTDSQQQSKAQQNVSCDKSKRKNKGVVLVIDRLISKQTKLGSSEGEKG